MGKMEGKPGCFKAFIYLGYHQKLIFDLSGCQSCPRIVHTHNHLVFKSSLVTWCRTCMHALSSSNGILHNSTGWQPYCQLNFFQNKVFRKIYLSWHLCCLLLQKVVELMKMLQCSKCATTD